MKMRQLAARVILSGSCAGFFMTSATALGQTTLPSTAPAAATEHTLALNDQISIKLALIPAGKFMMGSPSDEKDRVGNEGPRHQVTITKAFYMGAGSVTQEQYQALMGDNPSMRTGPTRPVERVTWTKAVEFCKKASAKSGQTVRLPTEAEWEYACRAGSTTRYCFGDDQAGLNDYAWIARNSGDSSHPICEKKPNAWGLYDMHGNVLNWCADWYAKSYPAGDAVDPTGPETGEFRIMRGGALNDPPTFSRSAFRRYHPPEKVSPGVGFRVVMEVR